MDERTQYIQEVIKKYKGQKIMIYGASVIARTFYEEFQKNGGTIEAFCVTDQSLNTKEIEGIPVIAFQDISKDVLAQIVFIICAKPVNADKIASYLEENGVELYESIPESIATMKIFEKRIIVPGMEITTKIGCSIACKFCPQAALNQNYGMQRDRMMSLETYKTCIDKMPQDTVVVFSGFCEPFLNPECIDMMEYTVQTGRQMCLHTTLVGLTMEQAGRLAKLPLEEVTLHTPDADEFAKIPVTQEYKEVLDYLLNVKRPDGKAFFDMANCQSIPEPEILKLINQRVSFSNMELLDRAGNLESEEINQNINWSGTIVCKKSVKLNRNVLLPDGSVVLCCMDFGLRHILGNLKEASYEELMNGKELSHVKECMKNGEDVLCRHCSLAK